MYVYYFLFFMTALNESKLVGKEEKNDIFLFGKIIIIRRILSLLLLRCSWQPSALACQWLAGIITSTSKWSGEKTRKATKILQNCKRQMMSSSSAFGSYENDQQNINEVKAEEETLNRSLHQPMKSWFNGLTSSKFKEKYGPFPSFWQDMSTYAHLKIIRKLYLKTSDMGKGEYDIDEVETKVLATQASEFPPHPHPRHHLWQW